MKIYHVKNFEITSQKIRFEISGNWITVPLQDTASPILPRAELQKLQIFEIDPYGIGIHWPLLDEDLSVAGLLKIAGREDLAVDPKQDSNWYSSKSKLRSYRLLSCWMPAQQCVTSDRDCEQTWH